MSVRKIPIATRSITGRHAKDGVPFESTLERDFVTLCAFDDAVASIESQPISLSYRAPSGRSYRYTPDYLVRYHQLPGATRPERLCEIKYEEDLLENGQKYAAKFAAAAAFASERGWSFEVVTEVSIRTPYLDNVRFLLPYKQVVSDRADVELIQSVFAGGPPTMTVANLLALHSEDPLERARLLPAVWAMVAQGTILADLQQKLSMSSPLMPAWNGKE